MNSLVSMVSFVAESRVEEHLAAAERARLLRQAGHTGFVARLRRIAGVMLVRTGEWVSPAPRPAAEPVTDQATDQALLRLAR